MALVPVVVADLRSSLWLATMIPAAVVKLHGRVSVRWLARHVEGMPGEPTPPVVGGDGTPRSQVSDDEIVRSLFKLLTVAAFHVVALMTTLPGARG
jgi:hypothetical protein